MFRYRKNLYNNNNNMATLPPAKELKIQVVSWQNEIRTLDVLKSPTWGGGGGGESWSIYLTKKQKALTFFFLFFFFLVHSLFHRSQMVNFKENYN